MTIYAGETIRVATTAVDFDSSTPIVDSDVVSATIEIFDGQDLLVNESLLWNPDLSEWYYDWDTTGVDPGSYRARLKLSGAEWHTWEYVTVRFKANPV
jgi:hypothetical protein